MSAVTGDVTNNPSAAQAFNRFGFGGRPDDTIPGAPMAWLAAQINCVDTAPAGQSVQQAFALVYATLTAPPGSTQRASLSAQLLANYQGEAQSFLANAVTTKMPFRERLVWFWSNHFAVMANHGLDTLVSAGPYVRDAIRPNVTATVAQMLQAAILHPSMLSSLNAEASVGPQSPKAIIAARHGIFQDINENLGRETLELYSLGYNQGYVQADVDAMAYLLSGMDINIAPGAPLGAFYNPAKQQPGNVTLMGTVYPCTQSGLAGALKMLGTHPNTYLHLATKLVTHFVSDTPSPGDIATVTQAFATTGGSLAAAHRAIIGLQNAWIPQQKLKTPVELLVSALRATGAAAASLPTNLAGTAKSLGQQTWCPGFPDGWSDFASDWNGPAAMMIRSDWSWHQGALLAGINVAATVRASIAPFLSTQTQAALAGLKTSQQQFALLFCSPEFQRR
jgi:uncharacterized protein (DUF1800 family)